jgi:hypothetical protein
MAVTGGYQRSSIRVIQFQGTGQQAHLCRMG